MAKATKTATASNGKQAHLVDLGRLSQQEISKLTGKPAVWFRDNSHIDGANVDGTYDAPQIVRALRGEFQAVELSDGQLEPALQLCERLTHTLNRPDLDLAPIEEIERIHGVAGLAAVGQLLLDCLRQSQALEETSPRPLPTAAEIRTRLHAAADTEANRQIAKLPEWDAREFGRLAVKCESCDSFRWGRTWKQPPMPMGYIKADYVGCCPTCEKKRKKTLG